MSISYALFQNAKRSIVTHRTDRLGKGELYKYANYQYFSQNQCLVQQRNWDFDHLGHHNLS